MPALFPVIGLSFVAGFVDTVGFIALFGLFTAHVTGNFVLLGAGLAGQSAGVVTKLLALPIFILVVALVTVAVRRAEAAGRNLAFPVILAQVALLFLFMLAGISTAPFDHPDTLDAALTGLTGVAAMSVQNAAGRLTQLGTPTTVMTGNVTQAVIDAVDMLRGDEKGDGARIRSLVAAVIGFAAGALSGALGYITLSYASLAAPILVLLILAFVPAKIRGG